MAEGVYFDFKLDVSVAGSPPMKRFKFKYDHKGLRVLSEIVKTAYSSPKASIDDLLADPFGGWAYLVQWGLKTQLPEVTVDDASDLIDKWVKEGNEFKGVRKKIEDALVAAGYFRRPKAELPEPDPNAQSLEQ